MNNLGVEAILINCDEELIHIESLIALIGPLNNMVPYFNKYAIIRACGTIETSFKTIIVDHCNKRSKIQVKNYLNKKVRESSTNPSYDKIIRTLKDFDENWADQLKNNLRALPNYNSILTSLQSLVDARNEFAHGGNPNVAFADAKRYFLETKEIINQLDIIIQ